MGEPGAGQGGTGQVGTGQVGTGQVCTSRFGTCPVRTSQIKTSEVCTGQNGPVLLGTRVWPYSVLLVYNKNNKNVKYYLCCIYYSYYIEFTI